MRGCAITLLAVAALTGCTNSATSSTPSAATNPPAAPRGVSPSRPHRGHHPVPAATTTAASQFGRQTKTSGCRAHGQLPDPGCTPGSIITQATLSRICVAGYTHAVRDVPDALKQKVYAEYGITSKRAGHYEVDHLVPLELGGSNSIANLWPQIAPGYGEKDHVENELHNAACSSSIALRAAQTGIARDWRHAGAAVPAAATPPTVRSAPSASTPGTQQSASGFCASHMCIANFADGHGTIVQCQDGEWSHSGGRPGVCNRHGGPR